MTHLGLLRSVSLEIEMLVIYIFIQSDHLNQSLKMFVCSTAWPHEELLYKKKKKKKQWQKQPALSRNAATGGAKPPTPGQA